MPVLFLLLLTSVLVVSLVLVEFGVLHLFWDLDVRQLLGVPLLVKGYHLILHGSWASWQGD